jgi:hypothetical protein
MPPKQLRSFHDDVNNKEYIILKNLWYAVRDDIDGNIVPNDNNVDVLTNPFSEYAHNIRSLRTSPDDGFVNIDGNLFNLSYEGIRIPKNNDNTTVTTPVFKETFIINTPTGSVSGCAVYPDSGSGDTTTIAMTEWILNGGTGEFKDANFATITYDNDGFRFGYKFSRRIRIMNVIDKDPEPEP